MSTAYKLDYSGGIGPTLAMPLRLPEQYNPDGWTHLHVWPASTWNEVLRRTIDVAGSIVLLLLTLPVMAAAILAIRLTSRGPAVFRQVRAGRYGQPFVMYKLRTMRHNAPHLRLAEQDEGRNGPAFKLRNDPRVTHIGRLLRRTSIDELPQLLNVLRGEMSLVGPRPLPLHQVRLGTLSERARISVKPGLTGLWQVSGRADIPYDEWVELDLYYVQHRSIRLDLQILLKTIPAVLTCRGAY